MNNCEKKLDALIDALGFDVEELKIKKTIFSKTMGIDYVDDVDYKLNKRSTKKRNKSAEEMLDEATVRMGKQ